MIIGYLKAIIIIALWENYCKHLTPNQLASLTSCNVGDISAELLSIDKRETIIQISTLHYTRHNKRDERTIHLLLPPCE